MKIKKVFSTAVLLAALVGVTAGCSNPFTENKDLKEQVSTYEENEVGYKEMIASLNTSVANKELKIQELEASKAELESTIEEKEALIAEHIAKGTADAATIASLEAELETSKIELDLINAQLTEKDAEIANLNTRLESLQGEYVWTDYGTTSLYDYRVDYSVREDIKLNELTDYQIYVANSDSKVFVTFIPFVNGIGVNKNIVGYYKEYDLINSVKISLNDQDNLIITQDSFTYDIAMHERDMYENMNIYHLGNIYDSNGNSWYLGQDITSDELDLTSFFADKTSGTYELEIHYNYRITIDNGDGTTASMDYGSSCRVEIEYISLEAE